MTRKRSYTTQGEKAAIIKELREKGYALKHLLKAVGLSKSTCYYELKHVCFDSVKNQNLMDEIKKIFDDNKHRYAVQYQHTYYCNELKKHGIIQSMSRKGNCYDNCIVGTFFGRLKTEMFYGYEKDCESFEKSSKAINKYIDYYNNKRIQSKTNWMTPVIYRKTSSIRA